MRILKRKYFSLGSRCKSSCGTLIQSRKQKIKAIVQPTLANKHATHFSEVSKKHNKKSQHICISKSHCL